MTVGTSVQDQVYHALRTGILTLGLEPGTIMSTQELANRLKVSRTPVREALIRLQRDGLVVILPQRETMVSLINMARAKQERFMRRCLEASVLEAFLQGGAAAPLQYLYDLVDKQQQANASAACEALLEYDNAFHRFFFEQADQLLSWDILQQMTTHYQRARLLSLKMLGPSTPIVAQHISLLNAIERGGLSDALHVLNSHLGRLDAEAVELRAAYPGFFEDPHKKAGVHLD